MKSVIYLTTSTSATASMWRIFSEIVSTKYIKNNIVVDYHAKGEIDKLGSLVLPKENNLIRFHQPNRFNINMQLNDYRYLINYRDPRDYLCNLYHWGLIHPKHKNESEEEIKKRAEILKSEGIDSFVKKRAGTKYYENIFYVLRNISSDQYCVNSYARLCLDFDSFIERAADFLEVELTPELRDKLEIERIEKLAENPKWIGNKWEGSDTMPGRYKRELKPETIEILNEKLAEVLKNMAKYDPDYAELYLEGVK